MAIIADGGQSMPQLLQEEAWMHECGAQAFLGRLGALGLGIWSMFSIKLGKLLKRFV